MLKVLITAIAVLATPAMAEDGPRLYDVTGVNADDVLNIRASPSPSAPVIATLPADATGIEVTDRTVTRRWARVNTQENIGWVSTRFLSPQARAIDNYNLPVGLRCFGTEPFWSLTNDNGSLTYSNADSTAMSFPVAIAQDTGIADDLRRMIRLDGNAVAYLTPGQCNDGMSDRQYALSVSFMPGADAPLLTGCCTLAP